MRTLILGGTRFVGPPLVRQLVQDGHDVAVFHRGKMESDLPASVTHFHGDFRSFADHVDELRHFGPDVVVDDVPHVDKSGHGVHHFIGVAERAIILSSGDVYRAFARVLGSEPGPADPVPLTEDSALRAGPSPDLTPEIDYDNLEAERASREQSDLPVTVLRLPVIFGPGDPYNRLYPYIKRIDDGRSVILLDERLVGWRWSRGFVDNVAAAIALAVRGERSAGRIYNVAPLDTPTEAEWVRSIGRALGWNGKVVAVTPELLPETMRSPIDTSQDIWMDSSRIRHELGYEEPISPRQALRRTAAWTRANPSEEVEVDYAAEDRVLAALEDLGVR